MKQIFGLFVLLLSVATHAQDRDKDNQLSKEYFTRAGYFAQNYQPDSAAHYFGLAARIFKKYKSWNNYYIAKNEMIVMKMQADKIKQSQTMLTNLIDSVEVCFEKPNEYVANVFFTQGRLFFMMRKLHDALYYYQEALNIRDSIGKNNDLKTIDLYNELGSTYNELSEYLMALEYYNKVLEARKQIFGENDPDLAQVYNNIGIVYQSQAEFDKAIDYKTKAVDIRKAAFGEQNPQVANFYSGIGAVYMDKGEMEFALQYYQRAVEIKKTLFGNKHLSLAEDYNSLGNLYEKRMNYTKALDYQIEAIEIQTQILGDNHPILAKSYDYAGRIYKSLGNYELAEKAYSKAIVIQKKFYGEIHPDLASFYNNLGNVYSHQKKAELALKTYAKALYIFGEFYGQGHPANIKPKLNVASEYYKLGQFEKAIENYHQSLMINVRNFNDDNYKANPTLANYYDMRSLLAALQGKAEALTGQYKNTNDKQFLELALHNYTMCDTLVVELRRTVNKQEDKYYISLLATKVYGGAIDVSLKLFDLNTDNKFYQEKAFFFSERNKQGTLLDALSAANAKKFAGLPQKVLDQDQHLNDQIAFYEKQLAETYDENVVKYYQAELFKLREKQQRFILKLENDFPEYHQIKYAENTITVAEIQQVLEPDEVLRTYFMADSLVTIIDIFPDDIKISITPKLLRFNFKIRKFRAALLSNDAADIDKYLDLAYEFYTMLFPNGLYTNVKKMIIVPDGELGTFPMEALITQAHTETRDMHLFPYLIKKLEIAYSYSAKLYSYTKQRKNQAQFDIEWIGMAPVFESENGEGITLANGWFVSTLQGSANEVDSIYTYFSDKGLHAQKELYDNASETFVKQNNWSRYRIVHIATHGIVNADQPELSSILLAPLGQADNDDILYSGEIYNLNLSTDLVVLSACETGLGKIMKGEGIIGLNRALLYAGARNLIVSLWKVADVPTAELMRHFYKSILRQGNDLSQSDYSHALFLAKLQLVNNPRLAHPYFWSPFILIGD